MDLKLFLDPVDERAFDEKLPPTSFQKSIFINKDIHYDLDGIDIAIIGITESRGSASEKDHGQAATAVRSELYKLTKTSGTNRVLDLGNLRNGPTFEDTILRLQEVIAHLLENKVLPIILGGSNDMVMGQYLGYESLDKLVTWLNVDARLDIQENTNADRSYLRKIFRHDPNYLFDYIHLGYQSYYVDAAELTMLEKLGFGTFRLGEFKTDIKSIEPVIREADLMSIDMSAIQRSYNPDCHGSNVFGYTGEEACQIAWYGGLNDKMSSFGLYNITCEMSENAGTAFVAATMIWYFIDGFYHRKGDKFFMSNDYLIYEVSFGGNPDSIRFYKSKLSEKWWMEIPDDGGDSVFLRNKMVPCDYSDYEMALQGEIPQRWVNAVSKST